MEFAVNSLDGLKSLLNEYQTKLIEYKTIIDNLTTHIEEMEKELHSKNFLADYEDELNKPHNRVFYTDQGNVIMSVDVGLIPEQYHNRCCYYPTMEYAKKSQTMKELNDKLLAFKWCYDKDYDVKRRTCSNTYIIYYNDDINKYTWASILSSGHNTVYFSTKEIAQLCCDWLNSLEDN